MQNYFIATILFLIIIVGGCVLQIFLSKKQNKWFGLILPIIFLIFSIIQVLGMTATSDNIFSVALSVIFIFLLSNIPTIILMGIYFVCREKIKRNKEIEKMNIQDL